jgi:hypothetical protein
MKKEDIINDQIKNCINNEKCKEFYTCIKEIAILGCDLTMKIIEGKQVFSDKEVRVIDNFNSTLKSLDIAIKNIVELESELSANN